MEYHKIMSSAHSKRIWTVNCLCLNFGINKETWGLGLYAVSNSSCYKSSRDFHCFSTLFQFITKMASNFANIDSFEDFFNFREGDGWSLNDLTNLTDVKMDEM